jgi:hypothetical protein
MQQQDPRFLGGVLAGLGSLISSPVGQQIAGQLPNIVGGLFGGRRDIGEMGGGAAGGMQQQDPRLFGALLPVLAPMAVQALSGLLSGRRDIGEMGGGAAGGMQQQDPRFLGGVLAGLGSLISSPVGQQIAGQLPNIVGGLFGGRREI